FGSPVVSFGALGIGAGSTAVGTVIVRGSNTLRGDVRPGQTVVVQGNDSGFNATLTADAGFSNAGTIALDSAGRFDWDATLAVTNGTLTNTATGVIAANPGSGGARTLDAQIDNRGAITINQAAILGESSAQ